MESHSMSPETSAMIPSRTPNLAGIFHKFPHLPLELRLLIWKQALYQLDMKGQPLFAKLPHTLEKEAALLEIFEHTTESSKLVEYPEHAPSNCKQFSMHGTPSMHFVDASIWLACKESQTVLKQAIKDCARSKSEDKTVKTSGSQTLREMPDSDSSSADATDSFTSQTCQLKTDGRASAVTFNCELLCYQLWKDKEAVIPRPLRFPLESFGCDFLGTLGTRGIVFEYDYS
ncbi:hypothetical protein BDP81DRAFT_414296 [Colletotrichum phormii]|uniref:2EXR domain-containing protein n=1 Tax=Colletotrichum phormii TaxID=359342 RepID=A0AAJ0A465_9PEZI|nr:uncharacterized protein BDP81DRAFT_414296 [Colletotrichum phormii]KAK1656158.1 hypothetical protein BDP81DRAFT_414296 [Colletotrichum phormii]